MVLELLSAMFSKWQRFVAFCLFSFLLALGIAACGGEPTSVGSQAQITPEDIAQLPVEATLEQIRESGQVKVAVPSDFPPFGFVNTSMEPIGYDIDMAKEIAKGLNAELEIIPVVGGYRIPFLQTDRVDMIISSLGKNDERDLIIDFSEPYAPFFSAIYGGPSAEIAVIEDLSNRSIGVAQGSLEDLEISSLTENISNVDIKRYANNSLTASALVSGQVDAIATGNIVAAKLIRDNPASEITSKFILKDSPCYVGVREGDTEFVDKINEIIALTKQSGRLNEMSQAWFGEPLPEAIAQTT
ncbi:transporter substrate-binding domain-containing protein [cf. Phormidesmis sp. LEGE 11477]|uniref:transporter substrate-binding domain-containing protein n=1 Tax=cf. Phormidesmis sp. LEGE 11477 TaxID=1828680 RepID=UPI00187EDF28|nr:transporter substrate-binding domain-containing protein [cf. Phormidesmis sp. LEGE 11477]MBE9061048.1 transporter substrate-binding domain-containing protein [cf. Phormidesmis sp. LEGE 11477]